jgi:Peptidase family C25
MCLFTHFAAGALAGGATGNIWAGMIAGAASHAVLDAIPHYDHPDWRLELGGGILSLIALIIMPFASWPAVLGGIFGMVPDLENLFQKLGKMRRDQFIFPSHTGLIPHGKTLGPKSLVWQVAIFIVCFGLLGVMSPGEVGAAPYRDEVSPVMGPPQVVLLSADWDRTVLRIDFPLESFAGDWGDVNPLLVRYRLPFVTESQDVENPRRLPPQFPVSLAVPTRQPVRTRILEREWWQEPNEPVADDELADFGGPVVYRSVPLSGAMVPLAVGGGVLRSLVLEVSHPATESSLDFLAQASAVDGKAGQPSWRELAPSGLVNPVAFSQLTKAARSESVARARNLNKASVPELFGLTSHWAKLSVSQSGVHVVNGQDLLLAGISTSAVHPGSLRLYRGGGLPLEADPSFPDSLQIERVGLNEVAIRVSGAEDGEWNLDDEFRFYGFGTVGWLDRFDQAGLPLEHYEHPSAEFAVYWLTWESSANSPLPGTPRRIVDVASPAQDAERVETCRMRLHFEEQTLPDMGRVWDNWVWDSAVDAGVPKNFELPALVPDSTARFVIDWRGNTDYKNRSNDFIRASAMANGDLDTRVSTDFTVGNQNDSLRVRLGGPFVPLTGQLNSVNLRNEGYGSTKRYLSLDSFDILYWSRLDMGAHLGQFEFAHWGDLVSSPGTHIDLEVTGPAGQAVQLWDVSEPDAPQPLLGGVSSYNAAAYAFGLTRGPGVNRHFVAHTEVQLLSVDRILLASPIVLRNEPVDMDYLVVHPGAFRQPATTLADYRSTMLPDTDTPVAGTVDVQDIYDNYSGGQKDWRAIRNYLHDVFESGGHRLRYVCMVGNACRDYRNYKNRTPLTDVFYDLLSTDVRTPFPTNPTVNRRLSPYATDDGLVSFDPPLYGDVDYPDLAIGRFPAVNLAEAEGMIERSIAYDSETVPGTWRNALLMVADDTHKDFSDPASNEQVHTEEAEFLVENLIPASLDVSKIFAVAYDFPLGASNKPEVRADINIALSKGTTIYHYIGHGSEDSLADERIFEISDIGNLTNGMMRTIFLAFSCDVGVYDSTHRRSMAEEFLTSSSGGAIASICASQVSYTSENDLLSEAFYRSLFPDRHVSHDRGLAQVLQAGKVAMNTTNARRNSQRYNVLGDPAMVIPHPVDDLEFSVDSLDSLKAGVVHTAILDAGGNKAVPANGDSYHLRIEESARTGYYDWLSYNFPDSLMEYRDYGSILFRGTGTADDGDLEIPFIVPGEVRFGSEGRVRLIVTASDGEHSAVATVPVVRNPEGIGGDLAGPVIRLAFEDGLQRVRPGASLFATLEDASGIAILGTSPGNSILLEFDDTGFMTDISESFQFDQNSYSSGRIDMVLPADLTMGDHQVALRASDGQGNVGADTLSFRIDDQIMTGVESVALFPNPTSGPCRLVFELGEPMDLQWDIYTLAGTRLRSITRIFDTAGPGSMSWDGLDQQADEIANGTYLYVLRGHTAAAGNRQFTQTGKLVIMR